MPSRDQVNDPMYSKLGFSLILKIINKSDAYNDIYEVLIFLMNVPFSKEYISRILREKNKPIVMIYEWLLKKCTKGSTKVCSIKSRKVLIDRSAFFPRLPGRIYPLISHTYGNHLKG